MRIHPRSRRLETESAFKVLARAQQLEAAGRDIVHLEIGQPDFPTPEHIREAAIQAIRDGKTGYVPAPGIPPLRAAIAADAAPPAPSRSCSTRSRRLSARATR
jgi:aspartate/methionine/tyrosine aminotransferase